MSVALANGPVTEVSKIFFAWAVKRWGYANDMDEHRRALVSSMVTLMHLKIDVEREVGRAVPRNDVWLWIQQSAEVIRDGMKYAEEYAQLGGGGKGFIRMVRPSSYRLGKRMITLNSAIKELSERGNFPQFTVPGMPEIVRRLPGGYIVGASQLKILDKILKCIRHPEIGRIGIYGKGGIGKTNIIKKIINEKLYGSNDFDVIIFVVVSRDMNIKKLRLSIAEEISLKLSPEEEDDRAANLLYNVLFEKKFFLVFDNVWQGIDLDALGVPLPNATNGCKIALTTRTITVCRRMETDKQIYVSDLLVNEAWELFSKKVGGVISPSFESTAKLVCEKCQGLPLALIVVGRALRLEKDERRWKHALNDLKSAYFGLQGMEEELFSTLKFSYDYLKNDALRDCFLYCSLFPGDYNINIDDLIRYWVTEGLVDVHKGFAVALDKARHEILKELLDSCLLEERYGGSTSIHMHHVIRDMAIKITSESERKFLVNAGKELDEWMGANDLNEIHKISLMENRIRTLTDAPNCPKLCTLLLLKNWCLEFIPDNFFTNMITLRVLDLSCTRIKSLPLSISGLVNLQALSLRSCNFLNSITHIGNLTSLLLLDLSRTGISELPNDIGKLSCLRYLDLSYTEKLVSISIGTISKLTRLEFLEMKESAYFKDSASKIYARKRKIPASSTLSKLSSLEFLKMNTSAYFSDGFSKKDVISDIACLRELRHLTLDVSSDHNDVSLIFLIIPKLVSFCIRVGSERLHIMDESRRCLQLGRATNFELARHADLLVLDNMNTLDRLSSVGALNLDKLRELQVYNCETIQKAIIDDVEHVLLPNLEVLVLHGTYKMPCVWEVKGMSGTFKSIKRIKLDRCTSATFVFSVDVISELGCLEKLEIVDCENMKQIVRGLNNQSKEISKLEYLELSGLSSLMALWEQEMLLPALRKISIRDCGTLKHLCLSKEIAPTLSCIIGEYEWWNNLLWISEAERSYFQPLFKNKSEITTTQPSGNEHPR